MKLAGTKAVCKVRICYSKLRPVAKFTSSCDIQLASADGLNQPGPSFVEHMEGFFEPQTCSLNFLQLEPRHFRSKFSAIVEDLEREGSSPGIGNSE